MIVFAISRVLSVNDRPERRITSDVCTRGTRWSPPSTPNQEGPAPAAHLAVVAFARFTTKRHRRTDMRSAVVRASAALPSVRPGAADGGPDHRRPSF